MERLAEQIVDWHNRHPLARRIAVRDVHTIGVVALPFVRAGAQAGGVVEPVLTDVVSAFDAMHDHPPQSRWSVIVQRVSGLLARRLNRQPRTQWRAFNQKFLPGLSPARIERFALDHGFAEPPATPETRPWRVIVIDESLASAHGGWPFELYLMSAGIDAGRGRTRVLTGRGIPSQVIGRRIWDPLRLGIAAGGLALLVAALAWALWPRHETPPQAGVPEAPASAPSSPASATRPASAAEPASAPASQAEAASAPASSPAEPAASAPEGEATSQPDIRPHLVQRADGIVRPPLRAEKPVEKPSGKAPEKPTDDKPAAKAAEARPADAKKPPEPADPRLERLAAAPGQAVVALVGPPGSKTDAEVLLKKMKAGLVGVVGNPDALQAEVIQTPEGWRAAVWPFPSREQAQLINATLVARGFRTKAVNF